MSVALTACASAPAPAADKVALTTSSDEARSLFLEGRDLADNLRTTDAYAAYQKAAAADPQFAMAYVGMANTSPSTSAFVDAVGKAAGLADGASDGERHMILGLQAGLTSDPAGQMSHATELVGLFPNDERAHGQLGNLYFGRQDYATAITHYNHAAGINPSYAPVYNMLGYAQRFAGNETEADAAFLKYIELIPSNPNPHDSYAEFLMEQGRFDESVAHFEQAITLDPNWVAGYVGIGNNRMFQGRYDEARASFAKELEIARNTGERRQAHQWMAASFVHEGDADKAIEHIEMGRALAVADSDAATAAGDDVLIGSILREAGRFDQSLARYAKAVETMNAATGVPAEFKSGVVRNALFHQGRVAVARGDMATAKARLASYTEQVAASGIPFEVRQQHELAGMVALADKDYATAHTELALADQRDPRVLMLTALAYQGAGDADQAMEAAVAVADYNSLHFNYGFVKKKAEDMAGR
jgi:tetratricopeptide (TPR) repeat protein